MKYRDDYIEEPAQLGLESAHLNSEEPSIPSRVITAPGLSAAKIAPQLATAGRGWNKSMLDSSTKV